MPKRILIVDDDPAIGSFIELIVRREGYEVKLVESAINLESVVGEFAPALIISDLMMPGRDGISLCRSLKSNPQTSGIQILLLSAKSFDSDKRAALNAGAAGYLVKPIRVPELINAIKMALSTDIAVKVWGCRGSIPTPERIDTKYGNNTPCISVDVPGHGLLIFDAGTGFRLLGHSLAKSSLRRLSLFLTHFHWDHIFGLPFFAPFYMPGNEIHIYAPADSTDALTEKIEKQMGGDYFPVSIEAFRAAVKFHALHQEKIEVEDVTLSTSYAFHPGTTLMYRVDVGNQSLVYAPDNEILPESVEPEISGEALKFAQFAAGASLLIHDCTYSRPQYEARRGWGHTCGAMLAAVAKQANVKRVLLFHHDPDSSDQQVEAIHQEFKEALAKGGADIPSEAASEGKTYTL